MKDGIYRVGLRDGRVYAAQIAGGRCVEVMYVGEVENPPRRRTKKWIARDFGHLAEIGERRRWERELAFQEELVELGERVPWHTRPRR